MADVSNLTQATEKDPTVASGAFVGIRRCTGL